MCMAHLQISQVLPATRMESFEFLTSPKDLPGLLQPQIEAELLSPDVPLQRGQELHFMMTRMGMSQSVRLRIEDVLKGSRLTYRQVEGLFMSWTHTMRFEEHGEKSTIVTDIIDYEMPFGILGTLADDLLVKGDMTRILESRLLKAKEHFGG